MHPRRRQARRILAGALLMLAITAIAATIFFLDDIRRALVPTYVIVGVFPEARALDPGTPVWIAGRPAGTVETVAMLPPGADRAGRIAADLRLPVQHMPLIRRDSELELTSPNLLGDPVVNLMPGTAPSPVLDPGDTLVARVPLRPGQVAAAADTLRQAFDSLLAAGRELEARARAREPAAEAVIASLRAADRELDALAAAYERGPLADFLADTAALATLDGVRTAADEIATRVEARTERLGDPALAAAVRRVGARAALLRERIDELRGLLGTHRGFLARLDADPALRDAIAAVRAQIDSLIAEVRKRPWRWLY